MKDKTDYTASELEDMLAEKKAFEKENDKLWGWLMKNISHDEWVERKRKFNHTTVKISNLKKKLSPKSKKTNIVEYNYIIT